eukprot:GHUV01034602.1.p1 GENE.GHUV01034602.1~~GHUV01034602.1.p1  ORF type:complete len:645 (+),score=93.84 GHUV01034602.1:385-2319(+)
MQLHRQLLQQPSSSHHHQREVATGSRPCRTPSRARSSSHHLGATLASQDGTVSYQPFCQSGLPSAFSSRTEGQHSLSSRSGDPTLPWQLPSKHARQPLFSCRPGLDGSSSVGAAGESEYVIREEALNRDSGLMRAAEERRDGPHNLQQFSSMMTQQGDLYKFMDCSAIATLIDYPFFLDPKGAALREIKKWLRAMEVMFNNYNQRGKTPLYISGLTKTGKSSVLNVLLPAIIRTDPIFGVCGPRELLVCRIDLKVLDPAQGYRGMLYTLLYQLCEWCGETGIQLDKELHTKIQASSPSTQRVVLQGLILKVLRSIKAPTIMLIDELQSWFTPLLPGTFEADVSGASSARIFWKEMTLYGSLDILWASTGSGMALVWTSLGLTPTADMSPLLDSFAVNLPATCSKTDLQRCLQQVQESKPIEGLPSADELATACGASPALVAFIAKWLALMKYKLTDGSAVKESVKGFIQDKLLAEMVRDWTYTLRLLAPHERGILLGLSDPLMGASTARLSSGVRQYLTPFLEDVDPVKLPGRVRLSSQAHRLLMKVAITSDGGLSEKSLESACFNSDIGFGEDFLLLLKLGNTVARAQEKKFAKPWDVVKTALEVGVLAPIRTYTHWLAVDPSCDCDHLRVWQVALVISAHGT